MEKGSIIKIKYIEKPVVTLICRRKYNIIINIINNNIIFFSLKYKYFIRIIFFVFIKYPAFFNKLYTEASYKSSIYITFSDKEDKKG